MFFSSVLQPSSINTLLPSSNGMGELSQPREAASDDSNLHPVSKKMSAPGILQPYLQVLTLYMLFVNRQYIHDLDGTHFLALSMYYIAPASLT